MGRDLLGVALFIMLLTSAIMLLAFVAGLFLTF